MTLRRHYKRFTWQIRRVYNITIPYQNYLSAPQHALPDFIGIGAMKSATSSMWHYLRQHPHVTLTDKKEIRFFDRHFRKGTRWYRGHFPLIDRIRDNNLIAGEITPDYAIHPLAASRIKQTVPDAKLILIMRNPSERAYSHYLHNVQRGYERKPFWDAVDNANRMKYLRQRIVNNPHYNCKEFIRYSYLERGFYLEQIKEYLKYFQRSQLCLLTYDDLKSDASIVMSRLCDFLRVSRYNFNTRKKHHVSTKKKEGTPPDVIERLGDFYYKANRQLEEFLGQSLDW